MNGDINTILSKLNDRLRREDIVITGGVADFLNFNEHNINYNTHIHDIDIYIHHEYLLDEISKILNCKYRKNYFFYIGRSEKTVTSIGVFDVEQYVFEGTGLDVFRIPDPRGFKSLNAINVMYDNKTYLVISPKSRYNQLMHTINNRLVNTPNDKRLLKYIKKLMLYRDIISN